VPAGQVEPLAGQAAAQHLEELAGALVPLVVVEEVAVGPLLDRVAAGDHVEPQPAAGQPLEGGRLLRGQRRQHEAGAEGDEELQPRG
jgi:hypothetical protein